MPDQKLNFLILDGISGVPLGLEIAETLEELGHTSTHFDCLKQRAIPLYGLRSAFSKAIDRRTSHDTFYCLPRLDAAALDTLAERSQPNVILVIGFIYKFFPPATLRRLAERHKARLLLYDTDSCNLYSRRREFIYFIEQELPVYDRILSFSKVTTRFFRDTRGLDAVHMPFGAKPIPLSNTPKTIDVLFVGSGDLRRIFLLEAIREHVTVRGNRWQRNAPLISAQLNARIDDRPVWGTELHTLLASAKIVLNITRTDFYGAETGVNLRIFEALAAGCFLLTDHCDEIAELFTVGKELETFRSSSELADKVRYYLAHDTERELIAKTGAATFYGKHTWQERLASTLLPVISAPSMATAPATSST